jgi:hypothetical protein
MKFSEGVQVLVSDAASAEATESFAQDGRLGQDGRAPYSPECVEQVSRKFVGVGFVRCVYHRLWTAHLLRCRFLRVINTVKDLGRILPGNGGG